MNKVAEIISGEIAQRGAITFARFMELALYCPVYGYYEREEDLVGRRGDFYTSVSVGSLFGELLAWQFAEWLGASHARGPTVQIVEAGAHDGRLGKDILGWLREKRPALFERLEYWIIEPSVQRRAWQERTLCGFAHHVHWVSDLAQLNKNRKSGITGIIFSNELLDSFPVHRWGWNAKQRAWFEWGVTVRDGRFAWMRMQGESNLEAPTPNSAESESKGASSSLLRQLPQYSNTPTLHQSTLPQLPDGFTIEVCPAAEQWWRAASGVLERGKLLTLDYGITAEELLLPERTHGTVRAYQKHHLNSNLLASPGLQDLTAHVNFSALQAAGETAGLNTEAFLTQEQFLNRIVAQVWRDESDFSEWSSQPTRQFQTLVHPEHLGRAFRVLIQARPAT